MDPGKSMAIHPCMGWHYNLFEDWPHTGLLSLFAILQRL